MQAWSGESWKWVDGTCSNTFFAVCKIPGNYRYLNCVLKNDLWAKKVFTFLKKNLTYSNNIFSPFINR